MCSARGMGVSPEFLISEIKLQEASALFPNRYNYDGTGVTVNLSTLGR